MTNYSRGSGLENHYCHMLIGEGWDFAQRTAGSHSPVDVICINHKTKMIKLIQCKPDKMSDNAKNKLLEANIALNGEFTVDFSVI